MIEKATVLGWELVVAKKENFKAGDLCVYCEIDSIFPDKPEFEFLRIRKFRIKTIKLKGQISQGICFPLSILPKRQSNYTEGEDVTAMLEITKHDPQAEYERIETERLASLDKNRMDKFLKRYAWYRKLIFKPARTPFPSFIRKTDEDRIQLFPNACEVWKGVQFTVTEKLDGQSGSYFVIPNPRKGIFRKKWIFGVCSRNFQLLKDDGSSYRTIAKQEKMKKKLVTWCKKNGMGIIVQGEIIGSKIQGNKYKRSGYEFYVFNVIAYKKGEDFYYNQNDQNAFCMNNSLLVVPKIEECTLPGSISEIVEMAKGNSVINKSICREGIVMRNYASRISFKVINPDFLLKYSE